MAAQIAATITATEDGFQVDLAEGLDQTGMANLAVALLAKIGEDPTLDLFQFQMDMAKGMAQMQRVSVEAGQAQVHADVEAEAVEDSPELGSGDPREGDPGNAPPG